jgi:hypothetical protein
VNSIWYGLLIMVIQVAIFLLVLDAIGREPNPIVDHGDGHDGHHDHHH